MTAIQLALAGLPSDPALNERPWVRETAEALIEALGAQRERRVLKGHEGPVLSVAFSPDGERIVSGAYDNTIRITWVGRDKKQLIERARERLPRELTDDEKRRYYVAMD